MTITQSDLTLSIAAHIRNDLDRLSQRDKEEGIKHKFLSDAERVEKFSFEIDGFYIDFSKTHISSELLDRYTDFAEKIDFDGARDKLFSGERINSTEDRAVLHTLLRDSDNQGLATHEAVFLKQAKRSEDQFLAQYQQIQTKLASREVPITDIIHVGIGGSSLGTQLLFESLTGIGVGVKIHFIGNIDAHQLVSVLAACDVSSTLVIGVSKTFTTAETLQNINSIGDWFIQHGVNNWLNQIFAVTASPESAAAFGVPEANVVSFPEWVGGRYSVWSSVSLSAALVLGIDKFKRFLAGASTVDKHFYRTPPKDNICFIAAALDHYYCNFMGSSSRAIFAYDYRLRSLVDYLQQLETESNGKDRQRDGSPVDQLTSAVVWGGVGTDVQHSVFQMLHQGTSLIPAEFILIKKPDHTHIEHHLELLANGLAQTAALLAGQNFEEVKEIHAGEGLSDLTLKAKIFSGDRPSTTMLLERLSPEALGSMLAFYEHRTFCSGVLLNINSYDQMGVELGKRLAKQLKPLLEGPESDSTNLDRSTLSLIRRVKSGV